MSSTLRMTIGLGLALLLAGCAVGPNFSPPVSGLPQQWFLAKAPQPKVAPSVEQPNPDWWALFKDRELIALERRVALANLDVRTATLRLAESRFQRGATASALFPNLNSNGSYEREKASANGLLGLFGNQNSGDGSERRLRHWRRRSAPQSALGAVEPVQPLAARVRCVLGTRYLGKGTARSRSGGCAGRSFR